MSWTAALQNPEGIRRIYSGNPPELHAVHVHEVTLSREGPTCKLRFDLPSYPTNPPAKWKSQGFNTTHVELFLLEVHMVDVRGLSVDPIVDIKLARREAVYLNAECESMRIEVVAGAAAIAKISGYLSE
ncbi:Imm50 family immunity protein [Streptomyces sp. B1866]|uniref:Imm50 family immunity protein n=1 Tax=Streptomyces sp. B1866 TaxID=3075431 RepID=UPI00289133B6|nr:Imm50 family immunity protein [Streptomyces sp. B1866]MDT3400676.1 Imm50 family immunity protein [Streptomyces sp. B1866]